MKLIFLKSQIRHDSYLDAASPIVSKWGGLLLLLFLIITMCQSVWNSLPPPASWNTNNSLWLLKPLLERRVQNCYTFTFYNVLSNTQLLSRDLECAKKIPPTPLHHQFELFTLTRNDPRFNAVYTKFWSIQMTQQIFRLIRPGNIFQSFVVQFWCVWIVASVSTCCVQSCYSAYVACN